MNVQALIDAVVQQTTLLIAQLATAGGIRAPLAHIASQVFLDLSRELNDRGVSRKVAADMFGMALRSYHAKIRRLEESETDPSRRSLWEAVFEFVQEHSPVSQQQVLMRFRHDSDPLVRGVLYDLVETGLVYQSGSGDQRVYREVPDSDLSTLREMENARSLYWMVWMYVYRNGPLGSDVIATQLSLEDDELESVLENLLAEQRIEQTDEGYVSQDCFIPMDEAAGWEAAVFDHYSALTTALSTKLRQMRQRTLPEDEVGGSTYTFDIWDGHPMADEARSLLKSVRAEVSDFNQRLREYNDEHLDEDTEVTEVVFYLGQAIVA